MTLKEFTHDRGFKSRKFIMVLIALLLCSGASVLWAVQTWDTNILRDLTDTVNTLTLGYCGISAARAAIPTASSSMAKVITTTRNTKATTQSAVVDNPRGPEEVI